jgi:hypothetical protein
VTWSATTTSSPSANGVPKLATSTPSSLSFVEVSGVVIVALPPVNRSATTSAIA